VSARNAKIIVALTLAVLSLVLAANSMTKPLGRDEQMYCTAGVLMAKGKMIYRDFSYPAQMPYHPLLYAAILRVLNTSWYLLVGRFVSVVCDVGVLICIAGIYRRIFKGFPVAGMLLGLAGGAFYVFNPSVDYANGYAWNHDIVILCVMLSFWLFLSTDFGSGGRYWRVAAIGGLLTFATCMRITTALVEILFLVMLLIQPAGSMKQRLKPPLLFLAVAGAVASWPIWIIAQQPRAFFLNLVKIPQIYGEWLHKIGMIYNKRDLTLDAITRPGYFVLIVLAAYLFVAVFFRHRLEIKEVRNLLFAPLLTVTFFIIAFIPPTIWQQYLAMPVPFWIISFAYPLLYLREFAEESSQSKRFRIAVVLIILCAVVAVGSQPIVLSRTLMLAAPEGWTPVQLHKISQDIAQRAKEPKLALTLAPLFALEGGCDIYTELSAGSIIYRVGDSMSDQERAITHTVGPKTLGELIEKSPPAVVIVGVEMEFLEEHLFKTAVKPDWERKVYENGTVAYFRP